MSNVVVLEMDTTLDIPADRVLEAAIGNMEYCILIGKDRDGKDYFASSKADHAEILWDLEQAKRFLLER